MSEQKNETLSLSALKEILADQAEQNAENLQTIIQELKKPTPLEQKKLDDFAKEQAALAEERKEAGTYQREKNAKDKEFREKICLHRGGKPDHSYAVFIPDDIGGYILCQKCQGVFRPEQQKVHFPKGYQGAAIFDTALFNRLWQQTPDQGVFA
jgi:glycerol-3-phosphate O-acyltransferase